MLVVRRSVCHRYAEARISPTRPERKGCPHARTSHLCVHLHAHARLRWGHTGSSGFRCSLPVLHRVQSVSCARNFSNEWLTTWGEREAELVSDVLLVVSELITNAVQHAAAPVALTLHNLKDGGVAVTVTDGGTVSPMPQAPDPDERGRGCFLVKAVARKSGCAIRPGG